MILSQILNLIISATVLFPNTATVIDSKDLVMDVGLRGWGGNTLQPTTYPLLDCRPLQGRNPSLMSSVNNPGLG